MAVLGWITFIMGGAYLVFCAAYLVTICRGGGLETLALGIQAGTIAAAAWVVFAIWLSPINISFG